ncbi:MAG: DUF3817 domain-containing protein [Nocardioides sp.]|nr:DUF3817 domain-containing protein [Nocardioides sp.]
MSSLTPRGLFRGLAVSEAITWALLLVGMFLKYVTETTDVAVSIFGMVHGVVFIGYCLVTLLVAIDQRWSPGRLVLGLAAAIPPFATVPFDRYAERSGLLGTDWRLRSAEPSGLLERLAAVLLRRPLRGLAVGLVAVVGLTGLALLVGPPA